MPHRRAEIFREIPHRWANKMTNAQQMPRGGVSWKGIFGPF